MGFQLTKLYIDAHRQGRYTFLALKEGSIHASACLPCQAHPRSETQRIPNTQRDRAGETRYFCLFSALDLFSPFELILRFPEFALILPLFLPGDYFSDIFPDRETFPH
jgi:hypothetical protein